MWFNSSPSIGHNCKHHEPKIVHRGLRCIGSPEWIRKFKSKIIRLKYKSDHDLAGLVNGKRSVKRVLEKKSIPYSLRIAG